MRPQLVPSDLETSDYMSTVMADTSMMTACSETLPELSQSTLYALYSSFGILYVLQSQLWGYKNLFLQRLAHPALPISWAPK